VTRAEVIFRDTPEALVVLREISGQFPALQDVVRRLDDSADLSRRQLEYSRLLLDRLGVKVDALAEDARLTKVDLDASHAAADAIPPGTPPGTAALG